MGLEDFVDEAVLERKIEALQKSVKSAEDARIEAERRLDVLAKTKTPPPRWLTAVPKSKVKHHGTLVLHLSDLHLDEKVDLVEMNGINKYDRHIAELRLERVFRKAVEIPRDYWNGTIYDGIVVNLGGDIFSGNIHDELRETNEDTMLGSVTHWIPRLAQGLRLLADEYGKVHVTCVPGNHGRSTPKKRHKKNARDNFDWFIGVQLQEMFGLIGDKRVTFGIGEATDTTFDVYGHKVLSFHGDETGGGSGIGGIWPPIMRMVAKKQSAHAALGRRFDLAIMGHWHQLTWGQGFIINGSLKGYDEFAKNLNFRPEDAQQALWVMSPERLITWRADIVAEDQASEGWQRAA